MLKISMRKYTKEEQVKILGNLDEFKQSRSYYYQERKKLAVKENLDWKVNVLSWKEGGTTSYRRMEYVRLLDAVNRRDIQLLQTEADKGIDSEFFINNVRNKNFNGILKKITEGQQLDSKQAERLYNDIKDSGAGLEFEAVKGGVSVRPLNLQTRDGIIKIFLSGADLVETIDVQGSDTMKDFVYSKLSKIVLYHPKKPKKAKKNTDGGFFNKRNNSKVDLSKLQIYNKKQIEASNGVDTHCLINALRKNGVKEKFINKVILATTDKGNIPRSMLNKIAELIRKDIILKSMINGKTKTTKYKTKSLYAKNKPCQLTIADNHFMPNIHLDISKYACDNYEKICHLENYNQITGFDKRKQVFKYNEKYSKVKTLYLFTVFKEKGLFVKDNNLKKFHEYDTAVENLLDDINSEQRETKIKAVKENKANIFYADIESVTTGNNALEVNVKFEESSKNSNESLVKSVFAEKLTKDHIMRSGKLKSKITNSKNINNQILMIGAVSELQEQVNIFNRVINNHDLGEKATVENFLNYITANGSHPAMCYFHNLKYDYALLEKHLSVISVVKKGSTLYSSKCFFKGQTVEFRDSLKILNMPLSKVPYNFELPKEYRKMEAINYSFYNVDNVDKRTTVKTYTEGLSIKNKNIFLELVKKHYSYKANDSSFNPTDYYKDYLKLDCLVLKKGIEAFTKSINTITGDTEGKNGLDINDSRTISSLTDKYLFKEGSYNKVYEMSGNLREYCSKAIFGGRVHVNPRFKKKLIKGRFSDFDAVSLYPSAIVRLCDDIGGIPAGAATRFKSEELKDWQSKKFSILTVNIKEIRKKRDVPRLAFRGKLKIEYVNEISNHKMVISNIGLENLITNHDIDFEILDGIYWENVNSKLGSLIKKLFQDRLTAKKANKDSLQQVIKLMLNSAYGKTIMSKSKEDLKIKSAYVRKGEEVSEFDTYYINHFNTIKSARKINEYQFELKEMALDISYNRAHIGVFILDMSKRIVDEVLNIVDDLGYPCYYGDTDSLHIDHKVIKPLSDRYRELYKKELIGKGLGQFHNDYSLKGVNKYKDDIVAVKSIFLGRKSYLDVIEGITDSGEIVHGVHVKLKGMTKAGIRHKINSLQESLNGDTAYGELINKHIKMYEDLATGEPMELTLNPFIEEEKSENVMFEFTQDGVRLRDTCHRILKF
jgi:hypothetical protein